MMTIVSNIWRICLKFNWFVYDPNWMLQLSEYVWILHSSVWVVFINFLLIDATDKSKISRNQKRLFFAVSLYPRSFFVNTPFKLNKNLTKIGGSCVLSVGSFFAHIFSRRQNSAKCMISKCLLFFFKHLPCCMYLNFWLW